MDMSFRPSSIQQPSIWRIAGRALHTSLRRPGLLLLLALTVTSARLLLQPSIAQVVESVLEVAVGRAQSIPLLQLIMASVFAISLVGVSAGAVFGLASNSWPISRLAEQLRHAPAYAVAAVAASLGVLAAMGAELSTVMLLPSQGKPAAHALGVLGSSLIFGVLALLCGASGLLALIRLGRLDTSSVQVIGDGLLDLGQALLAVLSRPLRVLALTNAALLVTLPFALVFWATQIFSLSASAWTQLPLLLGQNLCLSVALLTSALTLERGIEPNSALAVPKLASEA